MGLIFFAGWSLCAQRQRLDLEKIWDISTGGFVSQSSPALSPNGDTVYIGVELNNGRAGQLIAVNTDNGAPRWNAVRGWPITAAPVVSASGDTVYFAANTELYAVNATNGVNRWPGGVHFNGFINSAPALSAEGLLYVATSGGENALHAIRADGTREWAYREFGAAVGEGGYVLGSPAVAPDGTIYVGSFDRRLHAIEPNGAPKWKFGPVGRISSSPAIARDGTIYIGSEDQKMYAVSPNGEKKWEFGTNGPIQASPVLGADGTVYFAALDKNFYAINPDGTLKWSVSLRETNSASTAAVRGDGTIVVGSDNGIIRTLRPEDGEQERVFDTVALEPEPMESSPLVGPDGSVYIGYNRLYKLAGTDSPLSVASSWPTLGRDAARRGRQTETKAETFLVNLSTRAQIAGDQTLIVGFVVQSVGLDGRAHLVRAVGPTLGLLPDVNIVGAMPDPRLELFSGNVSISANDNWGQQATENFFSPNQIRETMVGVGAFPLADESRDAALIKLLPGGIYTAHAEAKDGRGGVALFEVYDARAGDAARLINLSTRGRVGTGENIMIAGFSVGGTERTRLLLRGIGPGLRQFGVADPLSRPVLELYSASGKAMRLPNQGWETEGLTGDLAIVAKTVGAFALETGSADAAMLITLDPGLYTLQVSGAGGTTGAALAEIYVVP